MCGGSEADGLICKIRNLQINELRADKIGKKAGVASGCFGSEPKEALFETILQAEVASPCEELEESCFFQT